MTGRDAIMDKYPDLEEKPQILTAISQFDINLAILGKLISPQGIR
jgi:hypothetical protein